MKYAIPLSNGKLSPHFGQSKEFMLINTDGAGKILHKEVLSTIDHNCGSLPRLLAGQGVKVILAGGMGLSPRMAFEKTGVEVVLGVTEADPEKAVLSHLTHTLVSGQNVCEHGDTVCDHSQNHGQHHWECH
jgi:ATP-binding protein involved in chromosome partitioning